VFSSANNWKRRKTRDWLAVLLAPRNVVTLVYALSYTTTSAVLPFMARRHLSDKGGVPEAYRGLYYGAVMSGYYMTKMIAAPLIGFLSDKVGRRRMLMMTFFGSSATFTATTVVGQHSIEGLLTCRLLMGCFAANGALMMAYIRDSVPKEGQSSAFAQHRCSALSKHKVKLCSSVFRNC
jgi:MFS transporter, DHA1 family, tetracycline resistance protein